MDTVRPPHSHSRREACQTAGSIRLAKDVILAVQDDSARLVDLNRGRFFALNATGTRMILDALQVGKNETARGIARDYCVAETQVRQDLDNLVRELKSRRLIQSSGASKPLRAPDTFLVAVLLTIAWLFFRLFGWMGTIRIFRRLGGVNGSRPAANDPIAVQAVDDVVRRVAAAHPLNTQCKERALVCWHLLRTRFAMSAEIIVGICCFPFQAHAWVECGSTILSDDATRCEIFTPVAKFK